MTKYTKEDYLGKVTRSLEDIVFVKPLYTQVPKLDSEGKFILEDK
jgi:hypothetical protein